MATGCRSPTSPRRRVRGDVRRLSDFLYELERRTDKPVVPDRVGQLGLGYLAGGLSGYCIGTGAPEYMRFPPTVAIKKDGELDPFSLTPRV